jgi:hypothetical protein
MTQPNPQPPIAATIAKALKSRRALRELGAKDASTA